MSETDPFEPARSARRRRSSGRRCLGGVGRASQRWRGAPPAPRSGDEGGGSLLDRIVSDGAVRVGVDLGFAPLQYRDPDTNEPTGYSIELTKLMMAELGAEIEYVEIPFSEIIAAGEAGRFDISGIQATNLPARGLQVAFAGAPAFLEGNYIMLQPESTITTQRGAEQRETSRSPCSPGRHRPQPPS